MAQQRTPSPQLHPLPPTPPTKNILFKLTPTTPTPPPQTCISPNRVFVHEDVHDSFVGELRKLMGQHLRMGNGLLATTTQGPLINSAAVEKVCLCDQIVFLIFFFFFFSLLFFSQYFVVVIHFFCLFLFVFSFVNLPTHPLLHQVIGHVTDATSKGARVLEGGRGRGWKDGEGVVDGGEGACFMEPTLLSDVSSDSLCFQQETFGPLIPVTKFVFLCIFLFFFSCFFQFLFFLSLFFLPSFFLH